MSFELQKDAYSLAKKKSHVTKASGDIKLQLETT